MRKLVGGCLLTLAILLGLALLLQGLLRDKFGLIASGDGTMAAIADHETGSVVVSADGSSRTVRTRLTVEYPDEVMVGSSVDILVTVTQFDVVNPGALKNTPPEKYVVSDSPQSPITEREALTWPVNISLSSGALDWTSIDQTRELDLGLGLPTKVGWSPGTKDTGKATVFIRMKNMVSDWGALPEAPQVFMTLNGQYLGAGENDEVPFSVVVLSKYGISDTLFHWLAIVGGIAGFITSTVLFGWAQRFFAWIRGRPAPNPPPGLGHGP